MHASDRRGQQSPEAPNTRFRSARIKIADLYLATPNGGSMRVWSLRASHPLSHLGTATQVVHVHGHAEAVDGHTDLDPGGGRPGLGSHAHHAFAILVIGVAKSAFRTATHAMPVLRGTSARPVFVTAAGMPRADAAEAESDVEPGRP